MLFFNQWPVSRYLSWPPINIRDRCLFMIAKNHPPSVLFIHLPHFQESARLDTIPFVFNVVRLLVDKGVSVTLCVWEKPRIDYQVFTDYSNFKLHYLREDLVSRLSFLSPVAFSLQVAASLKKKYR